MVPLVSTVNWIHRDIFLLVKGWFLWSPIFSGKWNGQGDSTKMQPKAHPIFVREAWNSTGGARGQPEVPRGSEDFPGRGPLKGLLGFSTQ